LKLFRHYFLTLFVALSFLFSGMIANASSYRTAHVSRNITVYRFIQGSSFATSRLGRHLRLKRGHRISITPFYHMGKDGYMLHVKGHGHHLYYARTNSSRWFKY